MSADALAELGLDGDTGSNTAETSAPAAEAAAAKAPREEVEIGELEFGSEDFIPALKRGGATGSKYEFDKLAAPVAKEDGTGFKYSTFTAVLQPGVDADKLKRSVQSATTAENRKQKEAKSKIYFVTRSKIVEGEFKGVTVFRVDDTIKAED